MGVFSLSTSGGEGWGEEAVRLILKATLNKRVPEYGRFFLGPNPAVVPIPTTRPTVAIRGT